jgi:hypothetical protein
MMHFETLEATYDEFNIAYAMVQGNEIQYCVMDVQLLKIGNPKIIGFKSYFTGHYL